MAYSSWKMMHQGANKQRKWSAERFANRPMFMDVWPVMWGDYQNLIKKYTFLEAHFGYARRVRVAMLRLMMRAGATDLRKSSAA